MKVRDKLFIALTGLIMFMGGVFFAISHGYLEDQFRAYATASEQSTAEQLSRFIAYAYQQTGGSWETAGAYVVTQVQPSRQGISYIQVKNNAGQVVLNGGTPSQDEVSVPIEVNSTRIGTLTASFNRPNHGITLEREILQYMTTATVWGTLITSIVALAIGVWIVRMMSRPLQRMTSAMRKIKAGDLRVKMEIVSKDEFGEVAQVFNDMTERLHFTEEARKHLVADVAHELRTPLTIIQGQLELIQQGVKPAEPATLLPIQDEVTRLTQLVQDLHQLSLAEVGKLSLNKQPTDLVQLVERIVENCAFEAEERNIELSFYSAVTRAVAPVDPNRIIQVFVNILANALRYTPDGGQIRVYLSRSENQSIRVAIADNGPGIAAEHLSHLFDRFYRANEDRSRESGGTGLGLAIAREFVEAHQGRVEVESTEGVGATFVISLPSSPDGDGE